MYIYRNMYFRNVIGHKKFRRQGTHNMCVCVCVCVCMSMCIDSIYTHAYIGIYIHTYIHTYIQEYIYTLLIHRNVLLAL